MSDPASSAPAATSAPAKSSRLLIGLLAGLNVSVLVGAGVFFFASNRAAAGGGAASPAEREEEAPEHELGPLVEFESLIVNTNDPGEDHYLKVTFELEVADEESVEAVESHMSPFRDRVIGHLTTLAVADVSGPEHVTTLRDALLEIAHTTFGHETVRGLYFTELLVQ